MSNLFSKGIKELRDKLIDTSRRNKLINYKRPSKTKNLKIIDESAEFIFNYLLKEEGVFKFDFIPEPGISQEDFEKIDKEIAEHKKELEKTFNQKNIESEKQLKFLIEGLEEEKKELQRQALLTAEERAKELGYDISKELPEIDLNSSDVEAKHTDDTLQTLHYPNEMEKILTSIERDARTIIEETGSNMLYLVLGLLRWKESNNSEEFNSSPLITIPVVLNKEKIANKYVFTLEYTSSGIDTNRSLAEKLNKDFGIILPELTEEHNYYNYLQEVKESISNQREWSLKHEIAIDFLKFGKILMYQDLDEENWKDGTPLSEKDIFKDIFEGKEIIGGSTFAEEYDIDNNILANKIPLVMNADSSQHSAILDVLEGKNVVIEGPPGTGKSQTISNLIAALMAEGKSVLFVSEKLAALEVVYKRLDAIGLSNFCLELHSHKSQKLKIIDSIKKRVETEFSNSITFNIEQIEAKKKELKTYIDLLHETYGAINKKIYNIFWSVEKHTNSAKYLKFDVVNANEYTAYKLSTTVESLNKYETFLNEYNFNSFYWKGLDTYNLSFVDIDTFVKTLKSLRDRYVDLRNQFQYINLEIADEYSESYKLKDFIAKYETSAIEYSKDLLLEINKNPKLYEEFLENYGKLKNIISDVSSDILSIKKHYSLFEQFILNTNKIDKILKHIKNESNLSNNKSIEFVRQLSKGISCLIELDETLLSSINDNYLNPIFSKQLESLKNDLEKHTQQKYNLGQIADISKINETSIEEIESVEKIIEDKKDSFFNFLSGELRSAKKFINSLLTENLPKNNSEWGPIIKAIKEYIYHKKSIETNDEYKKYFGKLFNGSNTVIPPIEKLYSFAKSIKEQINISEIQSLLFNDNTSILNMLTSHSDALANNLIYHDKLVEELENLSDKKFIKKLYYDKEDIDLIDLRDKLDTLSNDIEYLLESLEKNIGVISDSDNEKNLFTLINRDNLEEVFISLKRNDVSINNFLSNFETFINLASKIGNISVESDTEITDEVYNEISRTKEFYDLIYGSDIDNSLKNCLIENIDVIETLKNISIIQSDIEKLYSEIDTKGSINQEFFGVNLSIDGCIDKLNQVDENIKELSVWINLRQITHDLTLQGLEPIIKAIESEDLPVDKMVENFYYNFYHTLLKEVFRTNEIFNKFNRLSHEESIKRYRELDLKLIEYNKKRVALLASKREIPTGYRGNRKADLTEYSLIENEINKKTRHIPIRQLVKRAPNALKALKPCFMMSPLSVSQYLPPNKVEFDVLIVDEASQLKPEEALGAIARVNQIVIVGDPKQLPPTSFFDSMNKKDDEETVASESESILDICLNLYKPIRQLRWHYRSQHESLIDFSNKQFYDGNLIVFPSPSSKNSDDLGIKYHYIENSAYQNSRNKVEAKIIVEHLEKQMKNYPDRSVGIGTFNSTQRDLIQDMVDEREKESPVISNYIAKWSKTSEPFFIKNLENLQGDERDVIIISTTFGKDKDTSKVYQRFGPINSDTGWRRLNVMFTRAKQKMEVFTSMRSSDVIVSENSSRGVRSLKAFLNYLEKGVVSEAPEITNRDFDSEFEVSVYNILKDCGYDCVPQVGVAGYFIDLAVTSTKNPNDFVLAIECDGATYHSSKSARDRDRLKQDVLETLGWDVYRIWSVDWYKNRENEIAKLIRVVKESQAKYQEKIQSIPAQEIEIIDVTEIEEDIKEEIKKEKQEHHHKIETLSQNKYSQLFLSDEEIKEMLIKFRDEEISKDFEIDRRCILSDMMIELFIKHKPLNIDEFRNKIPKRYRDERIIHIEQMKYLNDIFDILELADE